MMDNVEKRLLGMEHSWWRGNDCVYVVPSSDVRKLLEEIEQLNSRIATLEAGWKTDTENIIILSCREEAFEADRDKWKAVAEGLAGSVSWHLFDMVWSVGDDEKMEAAMKAFREASDAKAE